MKTYDEVSLRQDTTGGACRECGHEADILCNCDAGFRYARMAFGICENCVLDWFKSFIRRSFEATRREVRRQESEKLNKFLRECSDEELEAFEEQMELEREAEDSFHS